MCRVGKQESFSVSFLNLVSLLLLHFWSTNANALECQEKVIITSNQYYYSVKNPSQSLDCSLLSPILLNDLSVKTACIEDLIVMQFKGDSQLFVSLIQSLSQVIEPDQINCFQKLVFSATFTYSITESEAMFYDEIFIMLSVNETIQSYDQSTQYQMKQQIDAIANMSYYLQTMQENTTFTFSTLTSIIQETKQTTDTKLRLLWGNITQSYNATTACAITTANYSDIIGYYYQEMIAQLVFMNNAVANLTEVIEQLTLANEQQKIKLDTLEMEINTLSTECISQQHIYTEVNLKWIMISVILLLQILISGVIIFFILRAKMRNSKKQRISTKDRNTSFYTSNQKTDNSTTVADCFMKPYDRQTMVNHSRWNKKKKSQTGNLTLFKHHD